MEQSNPFIESISINLFKGIFNTELYFKNGLNIISGENGTGKTQLIQLLKDSSSRKFYRDNSTNKIVVFNPLRNAQKRTRDEIFKELRTKDLNIKKINDALKKFTINDWKLTTYYSFGEIFVLTYEDLLEGGGITIEDSVTEIKDIFNTVLKQVFPQYEILAEWGNSKLSLSIKKQASIEVPLNALSRGESEVLALVFNVFANRDHEDIFLIDEPELHLNWDLERGLFRFLDWFCEEYKKQIIVATHSRLVFDSEFLQKTQFLIWENGLIVTRENPTEDIKSKIGGDVLQFVTALDIKKIVFYVEDDTQNKVVLILSEYFEQDIEVITTGNKENVKSICRYLTKAGYKNAYFLVDSDNQGESKEFKNNDKYIQLSKYCIENFFLNFDILSKISDKNQSDVKTIIQEAIQNSSVNQHTKVYKKLAENTEITPEILDTYNAKLIIKEVAKDLGFRSKEELIDKFLQKCSEENQLDYIFGEITAKFITI